MWNVKANVMLVIIGLTGTRYVAQTIPEQHTGKARNEGITKNSHIGHCTHTAESANVKLQNACHGK
jgi:hypothetical protein